MTSDKSHKEIALKAIAFCLALALGTAWPASALAEDIMKVTQTECSPLTKTCYHTQTVFRRDSGGGWVIVSTQSWTTPFRPEVAEP